MEQEPIVIVGAGYVGLTLGLFITSRRVSVLIVDTDAGKVEQLQRGDSTIYEAELRASLSTALQSGYLRFSCQPPARGARTWIIAVPYLPSELSKDSVDRYLRCLQPIRGTGSSPPVVMIRSTVPVGFTQSKIVPRLTELLGQPLDKGFFVSVCPERTLTGKAIQELGSIPQLVGGSPASVAETLPVLERCGFSCAVLENLEAAELGKAFCNLSRLTQFNLANFLGLCCERFGINTHELIRALETHYPRLHLPMPGPGVGGSCLPKDSLVLMDGLTEPSSASAQEIWDYPRQQYQANEEMIACVAQAVVDFTAPNASRPVLALGLAFKGMPRTDDTRNSVGLKIVEALLRNHVDVRVHDLTVPVPSVKALGLRPAPSPIDPTAYSSILLLNNDLGYLDLLRSGLSPNTPGTFGLYDPWRLLLSDSPSVFSKEVSWDWLREQLQPRTQEPQSNLGMALKR